MTWFGYEIAWWVGCGERAFGGGTGFDGGTDSGDEIGYGAG